MKLTDVAPVEVWEQLAQKIHDKFKVNSAVLDKENAIIHQPVGWANQACQAIKGNDESRVVCSTAQLSLANKARTEKKPVIEKCDVGFTKFVIPIFFKDEFIGSTGGCGVLLEGDEDPDEFYISKLLHIQAEEAKELIKNVSRISIDDLEKAIKYMQDELTKVLSRAD